MIDCDDLTATLARQTSDQLTLALLAEAEPVSAMHIDLAVFTAEQARTAEELCEAD